MYECIKDFKLEDYDDNGFATDTYTTVKKGSKWKADKNTNIIGGEIHLDNVNGSQWIEITEETFKLYFKEVINVRDMHYWR